MPHTPGPWEWDWGHSDNLYGDGFLAVLKQSRENESYDYYMHPHYEPIVQTDSRVYGPNDEDARLIAAAPELLEALKAMVAEWEKLTRYGSPIAKAANENLSTARAAIAKATDTR